MTIEEEYYTVEYRIGDDKWMSIKKYDCPILAENIGRNSIYREYRIIRHISVGETTIRTEIKHEIRN